MSKKIDKNELLTVLNDWNFWQKDLLIGVKRDDYLTKAKSFLKEGQILVITGARRSGKSFIMRQLIKELINSGIAPQETLMINFEDPRLPKLDVAALQEIYEIYLEALNPKVKPYIFLDEIQEVEGWEKWVRTMHELDKAHLIISGSNAKLLSQELATLLTGRHLDIEVSPLSFKEFLNFKQMTIKSQLDLVNQQIDIKRLFGEYSKYGGFPEVVLANNKEEVLLRYFDDLLNKDLIKRYKIRKVAAIKSLTKFYLSNISSLVTFHSLGNFLKIADDTVEKFSGYLDTAYLISLLKRFSFKTREQEKSPRKVYAIDVGLANFIGFNFSGNSGKLAENLVFLELNRLKAREPNLEVYYWKDNLHREVDFVVKKSQKASQLIQVCWQIHDIETKKRELKPLFKASDELKCDDLLVITGDYQAEENIDGRVVKFISLWQWLLK